VAEAHDVEQHHIAPMYVERTAPVALSLLVGIDALKGAAERLSIRIDAL
jgi:hypothetical protein